MFSPASSSRPRVDRDPYQLLGSGDDDDVDMGLVQQIFSVDGMVDSGCNIINTLTRLYWGDWEEFFAGNHREIVEFVDQVLEVSRPACSANGWDPDSRILVVGVLA